MYIPHCFSILSNALLSVNVVRLLVFCILLLIKSLAEICVKKWVKMGETVFLCNQLKHRGFRIGGI